LHIKNESGILKASKGRNLITRKGEKMPRLLKKVVEIEKNGEKKRYTNFLIEVEVNGNVVTVPIQPVNFGEQQNRRNYNTLSLCATLIKDDNQPY